MIYLLFLFLLYSFSQDETLAKGRYLRRLGSSTLIHFFLVRARANSRFRIAISFLVTVCLRDKLEINMHRAVPPRRLPRDSIVGCVIIYQHLFLLNAKRVHF